MNKGSPGGILMIAFGVLFLRLAYTGRIGAVWTALITGEQVGAAPGTSGVIEGSSQDETRKTQGVPACGKCPVVDCTGALRSSDCKPPYSWCQCNGVAGCCKTNAATDFGSAGQANSYFSFNAAGAPYMTAAGNGAT